MELGNRDQNPTNQLLSINRGESSQSAASFNSPNQGQLTRRDGSSPLTIETIPQEVIERRCWQRAAEIFNSTLTKDDKKRIDVETRPLHPSCSLQSLVESTIAAKTGLDESRTAFSKKMDTVISTFNEYGVVIDVMVQHAPDIVSIIWGSLRFLTSVAAREVEHREALGTAIVDLSKQLGQWTTYLQLFRGHERIEHAVSNLFAQLLNYLIRARCHFQKPLAVRYAKAGLTPSKQKFETILSSIRQSSVELDKEVTIAVENEHRSRAAKVNTEHVKQDEFRNESRDVHRRLDSAMIKQDETHLMTRSIGRFLAEATKNFQDEQNRKHRQESFNKLTAWLLSGLPATTSLPAREEGTCGWILRHPTYEQWNASNFARPLWIYGIPGCGKSALAQYLQQTSSISPTLIHFFQYSVDKASSLVSFFVASLLVQIFRNKYEIDSAELEECFRDLLPFVDCWPSAVDCPFEHIWPVLEKILLNLPQYCLIVDALDECTNLTDHSQLLVRLCELGHMDNSRVILLSRPHLSLDDLTDFTTHLEMEASLIEGDIMHFTDKRIGKNIKLQPIKNLIVEKVQTSSQGTFLWARIMMDDLTRARSVNDQIRRLNKFPRGLDRVYSRYLTEGSAALDTEEVVVRHEILALLVGAVRQLSLEDISTAIALNNSSGQIDDRDLLLDPKREILRLCWPLVRVADHHVRLIHMSVKDYLLRETESLKEPDKALRLSLEEVNSHLTSLSILKLCQQECYSTHEISLIVRSNAKSNNILTFAHDGRQYKDSPFYEYACRHWHVHATALTEPSCQLLRQIQSFLCARPFVYWSEALCSFESQYDMGPHIEVRALLQSWLQLLKPSLRLYLPLERYCYEAYQSLCEQLETEDPEDDSGILCRFRIGEWINLFSTTRGEALRSYESLLNDVNRKRGDKDRITQRAARHYANEQVVAGQLSKGVEILDSLKQTYLETSGEEDVEYFTIFSCAALGEFYLTRFDACLRDSDKARQGLRKLLGPMNREAFKCDMYHGYALEAQGHAAEALHCFENVWESWGTIMGPTNPLSIMAQCSIGAVYRQLKQYDNAAEFLNDNFAARQRVYGLGCDITIDSGLQLALLFREMGQIEQGNALIELISPAAHEGKMTERIHQIAHIQALLQKDSGDIDDACETLLEVLREQGVGDVAETNTRSLLWVRLTLADWLRLKGRDSEAQTLFRGIARTKTVENTSDQEQNQMAQDSDLCVVVESALRLVRASDADAASHLLAERNLEWARPDDFCIDFGGEMTNTARINEPAPKNESET